MNAAFQPGCSGVLKTWLFFWLVFALGSRWALADAPEDHADARRKVAILDFTSDDGLMHSAEGAAQWSALVQDALASRMPELEWVERAQLHLAAEELALSVAGFTSEGGALRLGKWLKADAAILGRFTRNAKNEDGHTLKLDIVDLDHADVLATRTIHLEGDRRAAIAPNPVLIPETVNALCDALNEAGAKLANAKPRPIIAPLFFRNADAAARLNHFGPDLLEAFFRSAARVGDVRVLRFGGADAARGEADLAARGLSEVDPDAWQRVADLYIWGSYRELPAPGKAFAQTPVAVELTLWDGKNPPRQLTNETTVAGLPVFAEKMAERCLDFARQAPAAHPAAAVAIRTEIAGSLREQGQRIETTLASQGAGRKAFLETPGGALLMQQQRLLLATACFFAPLDRAVQLARLRAGWENFPAVQQRLPLLDLWQRSNDLADFAARFGDPQGDMVRANVDADAYLLSRLHDGEGQIHVPGSEPNLPVDATDKNISAWHAVLDARFAQDAGVYVKLTAGSPGAKSESASYSYAVWMQTALQLMPNPTEAARVVEAIWPLYQGFYQAHASEEDSRYGYRSGGLVPAVQQLYARLRQPERAVALLNTPTAVKAPSSDTVMDHEKTVPFVTAAAGLPNLPPSFRVICFPTPATKTANPFGWTPAVQYVTQNLNVGNDDVLWISTIRGVDEVGSSVDQQVQEAWRFDPVDDSLQVLSIEGLTRQTPITSILPQTSGCWLTIGLNGIWQCEPETAKVVRRWTLADGLLTANMDAGVAVSDGLYFAGHENGRPLLNRFDQATRSWAIIDLPASAIDALPNAADPLPEPPQISPIVQLTIFQHWLLVRFGESWTLVDTANHQARDLREVLPAALRRSIASFAEVTRRAFVPGQIPLPLPQLCTADAHGFWLAAHGQILQFDPACPAAVRSWPLPRELTDGVTALASDGEDLWLAGSAATLHDEERINLPPRSPSSDKRKGFLAVMHEADGNWRGSLELPAPVGWMAMSRSVVYVDQQLAAQPLLEINKSAVLDGSSH